LFGLGFKHHHGMDERWIDGAIKKVNRRIGEIRSEQGITQARLAEKLDIGLIVFQRFERNRNLTLRNLFRLMAALDCDIRDFFNKPKTNRKGPGRPQKIKNSGKDRFQNQ
jgi:transcriptional regulator with XRE-family HTH domain